MIFKTMNSAYEVDLENNRVRRLHGKDAPTPRQGADGDWREFVQVIGLQEKSDGVIFVWSPGKITQTSPIVEIDYRPDN